MPGAALADLYTWTDERGTTVISNVMPSNPRRVTNFEVVVREDPKQPATKPARDAYDRATTEKLLLDRIDGLEREMKAQQAKAVAAPPPELAYTAAPYEYTADAFYPSYYPSYVFPYPPGGFWGYPQTTVVIGSQFGVPNRGFRNVRSFPAGRVVSHPVGHSVSVPVSVPVSHPFRVSVKR